MMWHKTLSLLLAAITAVSIVGCVSTAGTPFKSSLQTQEERLFEEYVQKGRAFEEEGDPVEALKHYKIALTIKPENREALDSRNRLDALLDAEAKDHFAKGVELQGEGKFGEARQQFLMALRLRPYDPQVIDMLTTRKRVFVERYVVHKIRPGESLSRLAAIYYGDYRLFPIIAKYNNLADATRIYAGQEIKVPEIRGMAFLAPEKQIETKVDEGSVEAFSDWVTLEDLLEQAGKGEPSQGEDESTDQLAYYREHGLELFHAGQYREAILEFNKVLCVNPQDSTAKEYTYRSHFQTAMALFKEKDYLAAKEHFAASLRYKSDCRECQVYMEQSDELFKEMHYKLGIQYYGKEQLVEAIKEWELVRDLDPNYKRVEYYINKATTIQQRLQELRGK